MLSWKPRPSTDVWWLILFRIPDGPFDVEDIHPCCKSVLSITVCFEQLIHAIEVLVFDIVYCNGVSLIDHPMEQRLEVLEAVVSERRGCLNFISRKEGTTFQHIVQALDEATILRYPDTWASIEVCLHCWRVFFQRQEGIVVKNPGSIYEPGARNHSWVKVKPDYIDELRDNCDLLIVGKWLCKNAIVHTC